MFRIFICTGYGGCLFPYRTLQTCTGYRGGNPVKNDELGRPQYLCAFGDGAGAAVVSAEGSQLLSMVQGSDGAGGMALHCENRPVNNLYRQLGAQHYAFTQMDGREIYKFAVRTVPKAVSEALEQAELPIEDVKYFLLHQANIRIIESVAKRLHQPMEKFPCNLQKCGNVSAASVPILLDNVHKHGMISGGDKIVLAGFGAGLTWGACAVEW